MQKQKTRLIVIAGPQSSGKTSVLKFISQKFLDIPIINEVNQYTILGKNHMGSVFVNSDIEIKVVKKDIEITKKINRHNLITVIETGILHCPYLERFCNAKTADKFFNNYLKIYKIFRPIVIFINTKPSVSWRRRKKIYYKRIMKQGIKDKKQIKNIMEKYKKGLFIMYPLWLKYYKKIPFEKYMIKNSHNEKKFFDKQIMVLLQSIINREEC